MPKQKMKKQYGNLWTLKISKSPSENPFPISKSATKRQTLDPSTKVVATRSLDVSGSSPASGADALLDVNVETVHFDMIIS